MLACTSQCVKWKQSWDFCTFQVHKIEVLRHLRTLPTVTPMSVRDVCRWSVDLVIWLNVITVTEHSSLPSLPIPFSKWLLSSPRCRMETAPGFSLWGVVMLHCGWSCLAALISSINKLNQHLFAQAGLQRDDVTLHGPRSAGAASFCCFKSETLDQEAGTHGCTHLLCRLILLEKAVPHVQKIAQSCEVEVLRHLHILRTVTPMSVRDVCRWSVDLVIWLNVINVTEHSSLPSLPNPFAKWLLSSPRCRMEAAPGFSLWGVVMLHLETLPSAVGDVCRQLAEFLIHLNLDWAFIVHYGPFFLCDLGRGMGGLWEGCRKGTVAPPNETCKLLGYKISNWQKSFTPPRRGHPERGYLEVPYSFRTCINRPCPLLLQLQLGIPMQLL